MNRSSYTASERRGILAIALVSLLIIGCGAIFSLCGRGGNSGENIIMVEEHPELVDSTAVKKKQQKDSKKKSKKKSKSSSSKSKTNKTYRKRSPLDEPV